MTLLIDQALACTLEAHEADHLADYAQALLERRPDPTAVVARYGAAVAVRVGEDYPINRAVGLGLPRWDAEALAAITALYHGAGLPAQIEITPLLDPAAFGALNRAGWRIKRVMNLHLHPLTELRAPSLASERLPASAAHTWAEALSAQYEPANPILADLAYAAALRADVTLWGIKAEEAWASVGALFMRNGLATLFSTGTRPERRGRGLQSGLIAARLAYAQEQGCRLALVSTVPGTISERNIVRAGFRLAYTKLILELPIAEGASRVL